MNIPIAQPTSNAVPKPHQLQRWSMIIDDSPQHFTANPSQPLAPMEFMLSEALLPDIRLLACLIAAQRLDFSAPTPAIISEEADWFAARILLLGVRVFHLDITLIPLLKTANQRARLFAQKHQLAFTPAQMRMSLHANRPEPLLIIEIETDFQEDLGLVQNSLRLAQHTEAIITSLLD